MKRLLIATLLQFPLIAAPGIRNTHIDQLDSLSTSGVSFIETPHSKGSVAFTPSEYLLSYSGAILSISRKDMIPKTTISVELAPTEPSTFRAEIMMSSEENNPEYTDGMEIHLKNATFGGAAPITPDGYFLTAAHVLKYDDNWISYRTAIDNLTTKTAKLRVVYKDKKTDLAIVKADLATERFLQIRSSPLKTGESLFAGSWYHMKAAGTYIGLIRNNKKPYKILTSIPLLEGDSGSPLIDKRGYLCGITSTVYVGKKTKREPESTFSMLDTELIFKEIEKDRSANKTVVTIPAAPPPPS